MPKGAGVKIVEMLHVEKHIDSTNVNSGRGLRTVEKVSDYGAWSEQDILTVIVDANRVDEIFEYIFFKRNSINREADLYFRQTYNDRHPFTCQKLRASIKFSI